MENSEVNYHLLHGFEDKRISPEIWNNLVHAGSTDEIFLTWHWQKVWWDVFGRGELILIMAETNGKPFFIAPLFADDGMIFFTGSGGSDYLDFIGNPVNFIIMERILQMAKDRLPQFHGFLFYHIPEDSFTSGFLEKIAARNNWYFYKENEYVSPRLDLTEYPAKALNAINKKSLVRHETWFKNNGELQIDHFNNREDITPLLEQLFNQHIERWSLTPYPSLFLKPEERLFYRTMTELLAETGWLCFTRVSWNGNPVAFHFGFNYNGSFFWYKPGYDINMAKHSPGEVLLRQLLIRAIDENAKIFDFGLGDEAFKRRFSSRNIRVTNWGLHPIKLDDYGKNTCS
jgi:CelD/BcsL family acetyltransferase involved in cellulose biosynthesis